MGVDEFVSRTVGLPWVRWRSDWRAVDCAGLVVLYLREVLGLAAGDVPHTDIATGFIGCPDWVECGPEEGAIGFMAWRSGAPTHCGLLLPGRRVLHAEGSHERGGSVKVSRLDAIRRLYGDVRFYRHAC